MKAFLSTLAMAAAAFAIRWEIVPLNQEAVSLFDPDTFDPNKYDGRLYNVTRYNVPGDITGNPKPPGVPGHLDGPNQQNTLDDPNQCISIGSPLGHEAYCMPFPGDDAMCNIAFYVPHTPLPAHPNNGKTTVDAFIYDNACVSILGCQTNVSKDLGWDHQTEIPTIQQDDRPNNLKYPAYFSPRYNYPPQFWYAGQTCKWPTCDGWSYMLYSDIDDNGQHTGNTIWVYRHNFKCDAP